MGKGLAIAAIVVGAVLIVFAVIWLSMVVANRRAALVPAKESSEPLELRQATGVLESITFQHRQSPLLLEPETLDGIRSFLEKRDRAHKPGDTATAIRLLHAVVEESEAHDMTGLREDTLTDATNLVNRYYDF